jgi:hypothetical protein
MAQGTELEAPSFFHDLVEGRQEEKSFSISKKVSPAKKEKGILQRIFWRAYRRNGVEAEGGAYGVTTYPNAYAEVSHHHALRA